MYKRQDYVEILNSDAVEFGGSGISNKKVTAKAEPMHSEQYRIALDIPPMSVMYFVPKNIRDPEDDKKKSEKAAKTVAEATEHATGKTTEKSVAKNNISHKGNDK